jgi:23S rRNA (uridine2552-2'-O)-methyltransferase
MSDYKKPDHWALKAQKENYPARSVYKLAEIDEKFGLLKPFVSKKAGSILDLGAAPGSWSLYVLRKCPAAPGSEKPLLVSADLLPLSRQYDKGLFDRGDFVFVRGDFTSPEIRKQIEARGPYALVLSDAAPATSGNRTVDTARSAALADEVLSFADAVLEKGGSLAAKVFQGGGSAALLAEFRARFGTAKTFKPKACRADSFETYFVGLGKK